MIRKNKLLIESIELTFLLIFIILIIGLFGCNKENNPMQPTSSTLSNLDLSSTSDNTTVGNPQTSLILTEAKVMIKDMKLEIDRPEGEKDEHFKTGPFVIYLTLDARVSLVASSAFPVGNYEKVKFEIHKLKEDEIPPDPDFVDNLGRYSVIVKGTFNGVPFIYKSKLSVKQKLNLQKALAVSAGQANNITFYAAPVIWFLDDNNNVLDPMLEANRHIIDHNIKDNIRHHIRVFVDCDHDGKPDN